MFSVTNQANGKSHQGKKRQQNINKEHQDAIMLPGLNFFASVANLKKVQDGQECLKELLQLGKDQIQE